MANAPTSPTGFYPPNPFAGETVQSHAFGVTVPKGALVTQTFNATQAAANSNTAVHAAVADNASTQTITTAITNPPTPRNLTATTTGTGANVGAIQLIITGTDFDNQPITETLPAFTAGANGSVTGVKAFKTVSQITLPAHAGTGVNTSVGFGSKLGLPHKLARNTVLAAYLNATKESTAPTVAVDSANLANNTVSLNSSLNGTQVDVYYMVP